DGEFYLLTAFPVGQSTTDYSLTGKDEEWDAYPDEAGDIGCYSALCPLWGQEDGEAIFLESTPDELNYDEEIINGNFERAIDGTGYKNIDITKRVFELGWRNDVVLSRAQIMQIKRLFKSLENLRMYLNPICSNSQLTGTKVVWGTTFYFQSQAEWLASDLYADLIAGKYGWASGSATFTSMAAAITGLIPDEMNDLCITVFQEPDTYPGYLIQKEYRISATSETSITLSDFWEIGSLDNGTYVYCISNAIVKFDPGVLKTTQIPVFGGLNAKSLPLNLGKIKIYEV
ncbi:MAG: hypothetical protein PHS34_09415, partial [Candidatus Omnitrophica bacterium]|nr:hypothetical protein [Candidatus Omnitrophota bacterium]